MSVCANSGGGNLEKPLENFLGTGNLPSRTGLGLMQDKGLTIMAENINRMRYMSHFRAIHRLVTDVAYMLYNRFPLLLLCSLQGENLQR